MPNWRSGVKVFGGNEPSIPHQTRTIKQQYHRQGYLAPIRKLAHKSWVFGSPRKWN